MAPPPTVSESFLDGKTFRRLFHFGLALKAIDGLLEGIGGTLLLFVPPSRIDAWLEVFVARELSNHPDDWIGRAVVHLAHAFSVDTRHFASLYLIAHGIAKLLLVIEVWRERPWAFPIALWFMGAFLVYQLYRVTHTHSITLVLLSAMDAFVLWVVWRDRQLVHQRNAAGPPASREGSAAI